MHIWKLYVKNENQKHREDYASMGFVVSAINEMSAREKAQDAAEGPYDWLSRDDVICEVIGESYLEHSKIFMEDYRQ